MSRVQPRNLEEKQRFDFLNVLWTCVAELKTRDEVKAFFKDLLSESEAIMLARRIKIAQRLLQGVEYDDIQAELHAGRSTIAGVHQWLTSGFKGYEAAIGNLSGSSSKRPNRSGSKRLTGLSTASKKKKMISAQPFSLLNLLRTKQ